jgi:hypothetical protein
MLVIVHSSGNEILEVKQRDAWNYLALPGIGASTKLTLLITK